MKTKYEHIAGKLLSSNDLRGPYTVEIDPTNHCPLSCRYCFWEEMRQTKESLREETLHNLINDLVHLNVKGIIFTGGGEPLSHPYTPKAIDEAKAGGIHVGLFTNGVLLNREISSSILPNLSWIRLNLSAPDKESYKEIHGADFYEQVIDNIKYCIEFKKKRNIKCRIGIGCILNPNFSNIKTIKTLIEMAEEIDLDFIQFKHDLIDIQEPVYDNWWRLVVVPKIKRYSQVFKKVSIEYSKSTYVNRQPEPCFIAGEMAIVKADGSVCLCKLHRDNPAMMVGNINDKSFYDLWFSDYRTRRLKLLSKKGCSICCQYQDINHYIAAHRKDNYRQICHRRQIDYKEHVDGYGENVYFL